MPSNRVGSKSNYAVGIRAENKIKAAYKHAGYSVNQSPGSRGAADLICKRGSTIHYVQVKTSQTGTAYISNKESGRVKMTATKNHATAVIAKIDKNGTKICYAKNKSVVNLTK